MVEDQQGVEIRTDILYEWQDVRHYRYSLERMESSGSTSSTKLLLADGEYLRISNSLDPVITKTDLQVQTPAEAASVFFYMQYGPVAGVRTVPELIANLSAENENFDPKNPRYAKVIDRDTWLGIPVEIVEYGPAWSEGSPELRASGQTIQSGGVGRAWVDPATAFILRNESTIGPGWSVVVELTSLEYNARFDPGTFRFVLPPGMTEVFATPGTQQAPSAPVR